jgi:hypothetical protein
MAGRTDGADVGSIQRIVAFEVCRKLGRRPAESCIRTWVAGITQAIDDVEIVVVDLPTPSGVYTVAFGRLRQVRSSLQNNSFFIEAVTS